MTTPLPLLRLPRLALIPVFNYMDPLDIISFSLLSERANKLSKSLRKISINSISAFVKSDYPRITVALKNDMSVGLHLYTEILPDEVNVMFRNGMISWEKGSITVAKLVERILEVTSCESLEYVILRGPLQLEVCDTLAQLSKLQKLVIVDTCSDSFAKKALEIILPVTTEISLYRIPFESREEFQTFPKSNLSELYIQSQFSTFTLDDFLVTNALKVELRQVLFSATDICQFLTNWFHSKHNSRLEHLSLLVNEDVNETRLLEVLNDVPFLGDRERTFSHSKQLGVLSISYCGGYDIKRTDGKKATIQFGTFYGAKSFDFYVDRALFEM
ncbi:hypothetical protein CRE_11471 [Caenorhabditis remanei]|uniref:F-box domain-containing protein n=1 Tax=Caenorhabditis remanei TaxID=31234 RepID=E3NBH9_CAERE|nr:hypothetical protein CRE_11471 [Caenorhabditis remanei]